MKPGNEGLGFVNTPGTPSGDDSAIKSLMNWHQDMQDN